MKKTLLLALGCLTMATASAQESGEERMVVKIHQLEEGTALYDSLPGAYVRGVSYDGEWAVGFGDVYTKWAFVWNRTTGNYELIRGAYKNISRACGVSNDGLVVGTYYDDISGDGGLGCMRPGTWKDSVWTPLPLEIEEKYLVEGEDPSVNGEACFISGDGAIITGYIYSSTFSRDFYDDLTGEWTETRTVGLLRPAIWTRKDDGTYYLERKWKSMPTGNELQQGAWSHYGSSQDGTVVAGVADHPTGSRSPAVWVGTVGKDAAMTRIYGKEDIDINLDDQYFYDGTMGSVSPNGKYAGGYWDPEGSGYTLQGFVYDTETGETEELENWGAVTAALDDGTLYGMSGYMGASYIRTADKSYNGSYRTYLESQYGAFTGNVPNTILSVSGDGTVVGGWYAVADAIGALMYPSIVQILPESQSIESTQTSSYAHTVLVIGDEVVAPTASALSLYDAQGTLLRHTDGSRASLAGLHGLVIAKASFSDGKTEIKKVVVK